MSRGVKQLYSYQEAYNLSLEIFKISKEFPPEEKFSLTDQIRRSSRSVCANITEAYGKRRFPRHFISKLSDSDTEKGETIFWLDMAKDCEYLDPERHQKLVDRYEKLGKMIGKMMEEPWKFAPKPSQFTQKKNRPVFQPARLSEAKYQNHDPKD
jgi:four helix bundle protein